MKIKRKLFLGFGLLFTVVLIFGAVSIYYIEKISESSKVTLKDNYETLLFTRDMRSVLDENNLPLTIAESGVFDKALKKQENNITEPGEKEATVALRKNFNVLALNKVNLIKQQATETEIRALLKTIDGLNLKAIVNKENSARAAVNNATLFLGAMCFITFLILFILIASFPGFILNPLIQFAEGLKEVSQRNYDTRLDLRTSEEFVHLSATFNVMAERLAEQKAISLAQILAEENRIVALIEEMQDAVFGINEKKEILFMNSQAKHILNCFDKMVIGKSVIELSENNNLLKIIVENELPNEPLKIDVDEKIMFFKQKNLEITVPNLKLKASYSVQHSGFPAGVIYILKNIPELQAHDGAAAE